MMSSDFSDFDVKSEKANTHHVKTIESPVVGTAKTEKYSAIREIETEEETTDPLATTNENPFVFFRKTDIPYLLLGTLANGLHAGTNVATTILMERLFNKLNNFQQAKYKTPNDFIADLKWATFSLALVGLGGWIFGWLETFFFSYMGERQIVRCRRVLYRSLLSRDYTWFETRKGLDGDLVQVNRSVEEYRTALSENLSMLLGSIFEIFGMTITSFIYSWRLTLLTLCLFPLMSLVIIIFGNKVEYWAKEEDDASANAISHIDWNLLSFVWVKITNAKDLENSKLKTILNKSEYCYRYFVLYTSIIGSSFGTLSMLMFVQSFWFGSWLIKKKHNTPGQVIASFYSCMNVSTTIAGLSELIVVFQKAAASFHKIMRFTLDSELSKKDLDYQIPQNGERLAFDLDGDIRFSNVSFSYSSRKDDQVLRNVSLKVPKNEMSFIIGKSGSGKSTISSLLAKLYTTESGFITIDGYDLSYLDDTYLRDQITLVQQFPTIFNDTLRKNLSYGTDVTQNDTHALYNALSVFNLKEFVQELPNGLNTFLGTGKRDNIQLSGGQEQRLNLARARLRDTPILILDESISAIDIQQREVLMTRIRDWRRGKTTIVITHELPLINDDKDNVVVLNGGEVVEYGLKTQLKLFNQNQSISFERKEAVEDITADKRKSHFEFETSDYFLNEKSKTNHNSGYMNYSFAVDAREKLARPEILTLDDEEEYEDLTNIRAPIFTAYKLVLQLMPFRYKMLYFVGLTISIGSACLSPVFSFFISKLINGIIPMSMGGLLSTGEQVKWAMAATGMAIAQSSLGLLSNICLDFAAERFCKRLRIATITKISNQGMCYFENVKANEVSTLIMNDMRDFRHVVSETLSHILSGIAIFIVCVAWTLTLDWKFALVGFSLFPLFGLFALGTTLFMQRYEFNYKDRLNTLEEFIHDSRLGIKTILCLNIKPELFSQFEKKVTEVLKYGLSRAAAMGLVANVSGFVVALSQAILYFYGLKLVAKGETSLVTITQIIMMISLSTAYISHIMSGAPNIYRGLRVGIKLNSILGLSDDENEVSGVLTPNLASLDTGIAFEFKDASFAYPSAPETLVLNNLNLKIPANTIFSFVGESGCGKSTIISLLLRLYKLEDISGGELDFNGYDINTIRLSHLRNTISVVSQKHFFFDGTFRENLMYNHPRPETINDELILGILAKLDLKDLIDELPDGLDSNLGVSRQLLVSGGQVQRLSIARALLRPSSILIVDECTSSLDSQNSSLVMDLLDELKKTKTIICITHKQEMMERSDIICHLKDGRVLEQGTYSNLLNQQGSFYQMVNTIA